MVCDGDIESCLEPEPQNGKIERTPSQLVIQYNSCLKKHIPKNMYFNQPIEATTITRVHLLVFKRTTCFAQN